MTTYTLTGHQVINASADLAADNDSFLMTGDGNRATGHAGYDHFVVNGANNHVHAGAGDDEILHQSGHRGSFDGGSGDDTIMGLGGDEIIGGAGTDFVIVDSSRYHGAMTLDLNGLTQGAEFDLPDGTRLLGVDAFGIGMGTGDDVVTASDTNTSYVNGGVGNDTLIGGALGDQLYGGAGHDSISGGDGADYLFAYAPYLYSVAPGPDVHNGDILMGDDSNDYLFGSEGSDTLDGGAGIDTVDFEQADRHRGITSKLTDAQGDGFARGAGKDVLIAIENINGSQYNDHFIGDSASNYLYGWTGADTLQGGKGGDYLYAGDHDNAIDVFVYRSAADSRPDSPDTIGQFEHGTDKIDLHRIDADGDSSNGDTAFTFGASLGTAGSATLTFDGTDSHILADVNGDGVADMAILVHGQIDTGDIVV